MALNQACDRQPWYTSIRELQLATIPFCVACRTVTTVHLTVDNETPPHLLAAADATLAMHGSENPVTARLPRLRALAVTWERDSSVELATPIYALADVDTFTFFADFNDSIANVAWPRRLRVLEFGDDFNQPVHSVSWPLTIDTLAFGYSFNHAVEGTAFPSSLQNLSFDDTFNRPIAGVSWPPSLRRLRFGLEFDQPIDGFVWPPSLRQIYLDGFFNRSIESVMWPTSLLKLRFGESFNMPVARVVWPASLKELIFGTHFEQDENRCMFYSSFNQALDKAIWPASLRRLTLGDTFAQSLHELGAWMPGLEYFTLLVEDYSLLVGVEWPKCLKKLTMYGKTGLGGVVVPPNVQVETRSKFDFKAF